MAGSPQDDISVKAELDSGQKRNRPERSSAQHRASIACIQCRTKHSRCDGYMPSCTRCKNDGKVCQYAKSRRGIRDPKKRNMIKDEASVTDQDTRTESTPSPNPPSIDNPLRSQMRLLDLYYANFHVAHSWLPPKPTYEQLLQEEPIEMRFLEATVDYIGSLYSSTDSTPLWERAYGMFQGPLPLTRWSVQALLSLSVASFGEENSIYRYLFGQAREYALQLGLQHKSYADEHDSIIAESCRRTYWGLYIHEMLLDMRDASGRQLLYLTKSNGCPELPCGEREYLECQDGKFPVQNPPHQHSSWAYLVGLMEIHDHYVASLLKGFELNLDALEETNQRITSWRLSLKDSRIDRVDDDGMVDMIIYHALALSYGLQIHSNTEAPEIARSRHSEYGGHSHGSVAPEPNVLLPHTLQPSLRLISLFVHIQPEKFSPSCMPYLKMVLDPLAASPDHRSRADFLLDNLKESGKFWSRSKTLLKTLEDMLMSATHGASHAAQFPAMATVPGTHSLSHTYEPLWYMSNTAGYMVPWPEYAAQSGMPWPGMLPQGFSDGSASSVVATTSGESFQSYSIEAEGSDGRSGTLSPHVKTEAQWR
ncbi:uncharacterized protein FIESC28_03682 [Fusarium coffeatum]|uniref:Zn(2)-C6 fungal-type domain-containing protein n=1 Tax=Fusarium coffeatum TaxID=231269 RepID=A0A366S4A3_9HYPO|nr:uncharacterized protein FIESC28_03682 [Fusarium coffeatum]RBR23500.1 hypothetical protein FIESC28_03682 [Fusarium coffeatum]